MSRAPTPFLVFYPYVQIDGGVAGIQNASDQRSPTRQSATARYNFTMQVGAVAIRLK